MGNGPDLVGLHPSKGGGWQRRGFSRAVVLVVFGLQAVQRTALCMFLVPTWPVALLFQGPVFLRFVTAWK